MISEASYHCIRVASPLTLVDDVDLVNRELGIIFTQTVDVVYEIFVLIGI